MLRLRRLAGTAGRRSKRGTKRTAGGSARAVAASARRNSAKYSALTGRALLLLSRCGVLQRIPNKFPVDVFFPAVVVLYRFPVAGTGHAGKKRAQHWTIDWPGRLQRRKGRQVGLVQRARLCRRSGCLPGQTAQNPAGAR